MRIYWYMLDMVKVQVEIREHTTKTTATEIDGQKWEVYYDDVDGYSHEECPPHIDEILCLRHLGRETEYGATLTPAALGPMVAVDELSNPYRYALCAYYSYDQEKPDYFAVCKEYKLTITEGKEKREAFMYARVYTNKDWADVKAKFISLISEKDEPPLKSNSLRPEEG